MTCSQNIKVNKIITKEKNERGWTRSYGIFFLASFYRWKLKLKWKFVMVGDVYACRCLYFTKPLFYLSKVWVRVALLLYRHLASLSIATTQTHTLKQNKKLNWIELRVDLSPPFPHPYCYEFPMRPYIAPISELWVLSLSAQLEMTCNHITNYFIVPPVPHF